MKTLLMGLLLALLQNVMGAGLIIINEVPDVSRPIELPPLQPLPREWLPARPIFRHTPLEVKSLKANARIAEQIAETEIEQEFYNPNPRQLEGTFILPLPKGASLEKFRMEVNGKMTEAELLTAEKARSIYEEIVRKMKDPALLEYLGRDLLKVRIFPIEPNSTKRIELKYSQVLKKEGGLVEYVLPLNVAKYCAAPIGKFSMKVELDAGTPLKTIYSPSHSIEVIRKTDNSATIGLEQAETRPDKDFQLFYSAEPSELGVSFLTYKRPGEDGYFMLLASPGIDSKGSRVLPKDVVFVADTSGSMNGPKLEQAKKALAFCVNSLNAEDRFEILRFSTEAEGLFTALAKADSENKRKATEFLGDFRATGGTAINDALKAALGLREERSSRAFVVVFLTDGQPTIGETKPDEILKNVKTGAEALTRIFCFGIGTDVNTHLLDEIAEQTSAVAQYILPEEDIEVKISSFFEKISNPVMADVRLEIEKARTTRMHPGKLPDLFKGQQAMVFGRYESGGKSMARIAGRVGEETREFEFPVVFAEEDREHDFIPRLWAARRVGYLLDEIRLRGENKELVEEVTELAKRYGIATPYTSFLVQEDLKGGGDPVTVLRRNPELMKEHFPRLYSQTFGGGAVSQAPAGAVAVEKSRQSLALRTADSAEALSDAGTVTGRYYPTAGRPARSGQVETQFRGGRTFYLQNGVWADSEIAGLEKTKEKTIQFNSREYYAFAEAHPEVREWLALGDRVKFLWEGTVYIIANNGR